MLYNTLCACQLDGRDTLGTVNSQNQCPDLYLNDKISIIICLLLYYVHFSLLFCTSIIRVSNAGNTTTNQRNVTLNLLQHAGM